MRPPKCQTFRFIYLFWIQHNSQLPKNYKEKEAFRQLIREGNIMCHIRDLPCCHIIFLSAWVSFVEGFPFLFSGIRKNENGTPEDEENFEEAIKNVNTALNPTKVELLTFEEL